MSTTEDMMSVEEAPEPAEMSRDELEEEVSSLRGSMNDLHETVDFLQDQLFRLEDVVTGEYDLATAEVATEQDGGVLDRLDDIENGDVDGSSPGYERERMCPAHRMWTDVEAGDGHTLGDTQERAATLFGQFVERGHFKNANKVDPSGQKYTLSSGEAQDVLKDAELLDGVKKESQSTIVARVMREVQRLSKFDDCDCEDIDECQHGLVEFRPGRPHALAATKKKFEASMSHAMQPIQADDSEGSDEDLDEVADEDGRTLDDLTNAKVSQ